jgi:hypothetical protein
VISRPATFLANQNKTTATVHHIIELTDGVDTWYIGTAEMNLSDGHVYGLIPQGGVSENGRSVDIFRKSWAPPQISVTAINKRFDKDGKRLSDVLGDVLGNEAKYYVAAGNVGALSDCLLRFPGEIIEQPTYNGNTISIEISDKVSHLNSVVNLRKVGDVYPAAPYYNRDKLIPMVYGERNENYWGNQDHDEDHLDGNGLTPAYLIVEDPPKYVVCDHQMESTTGSALFHDVGIDILAEAYDITPNANDSGLGTIAQAIYDSGFLGDTPVLAVKVKFLPTDTLPGVYDDESYTALNPDDACDGNINSQAIIKDNYTDDGNQRFGLALWGLRNWRPLRQIIENGMAGGVGGAFFIEHFYTDTDTDGMTALAVVYSRWYVARNLYAGTDIYVDQSDWPTALAENTASWLESISINHSELPTLGDDERFTTPCIAIGVNTSAGDPGADSTTSNTNLVRISEFRIMYLDGITDVPLLTWAAVRGREYGSWIDSRSSNYSSTDLIEDPIGICESMLRDLLGFDSDQIDEASFIAAENTSVTARISITAPTAVYQIMRTLSEQSTFAITIDADSKFRAIPLNDASPTTNDTIPYSHILGGADGIKISRSPIYGSIVRLKSGEIPEFGVFGSEETHTNSGAAVATYYDATFPNINGTAKDHILEHQFGDTDGDPKGLLSDPKMVVAFTTIGATHAQVDQGDYIELDSTSCDPHLLCDGASWSGKQFLIVMSRQTPQGTQLIGVDLET